MQFSPAASEKLPSEPEKTTRMLKALKAVLSGEPIVLTSDEVTPDLLESLFLQIRPVQRLRISFTTGLKPSPQRPFRLHLLDEGSVRNLRLVSQNLPVVSIAG